MEADEVKKAVDELLALKERPDAIITGSDRITIECFAELKKRDIQIPNEIALAGFSNFSAPQLFDPSLTTISQPAFEMGKLATELLLELIENKRKGKEFERRILPVELQVRKSTSERTKATTTINKV